VLDLIRSLSHSNNQKHSGLTMATTAPKRRRQTQLTLDDILKAGKDMMRRSEQVMGTIEVEERRFREMFGVGPGVALTCWSMLSTLDYVPEGGTLTHFLWTLCFLKVYPSESKGLFVLFVVGRISKLSASGLINSLTPLLTLSLSW
jgi:hypothetical protein